MLRPQMIPRTQISPAHRRPSRLILSDIVEQGFLKFGAIIFGTLLADNCWDNFFT